MTTEDAFVVMVRYDGDGPLKPWRLYRWPRTDWPALYKDAKNDDVHVLDEPLFRKLSDRPSVLATNDLLDLKRVELCSVDTGLSLWLKVPSLVLTMKNFETGRAYDPNVWTARQHHGFPISKCRCLSRGCKTKACFEWAANLSNGQTRVFCNLAFPSTMTPRLPSQCSKRRHRTRTRWPPMPHPSSN